MNDNEIIKMYNENGIQYLIDHYGMDEHKIRKVLKDNNVDRKPLRFGKELTDRLIKLYCDGYTQEKIGETLCIAEGTVGKVLLRNNIPLRSYSENNQRYKRNSNYFDLIDNSNKAYILGLLYADGCNHREHNSITLSLQDTDYEVVYRTKQELEYEGPISFIDKKKNKEIYHNQYRLCINDPHMSSQLEKLGVVNAKSLVLQFPRWLDEELIPHFVRGYFDGDGCIYNDLKRQKTQIQIVGTFEFCQGLSEQLYKLGCKHCVRQPRQSKGRNTYIVAINGNVSSNIFLSWIYKDADIYMQRKYEKYIYMMENFTKRRSHVA